MKDITLRVAAIKISIEKENQYTSQQLKKLEAAYRKKKQTKEFEAKKAEMKLEDEAVLAKIKTVLYRYASNKFKANNTPGFVTCMYSCDGVRIGKIGDSYFRCITGVDGVGVEIYDKTDIVKSDEYGHSFLCSSFKKHLGYYKKGKKVAFAREADKFDAFNYWGEWGNTTRFEEFKRDIMFYLDKSEKERIHHLFREEDLLPEEVKQQYMKK